MPFNIDTVKSNIENNGYLKNNSFDVVLVPPEILLNRNLNILGTPANIRNITNNLTFRIEQVRAPGVSLAVSQISPYGVGLTQAMPHNAQLQNISFSILVDGFGEIWQFWYNWVRSIFEFNGNDSARVGNANRLPGYVTEYKDNYSTTMQIVIYDVFGNAIQRINLIEAFPTSIGEIPFSWNDVGGLVRLPVTISFTEFTIVGSAVEGNLNQPLVSRNNFQTNRTVII